MSRSFGKRRYESATLGAVRKNKQAIDVVVLAQQMTTMPYVWNLNAVGQGSAKTQRTGREIFLRSLQYQLYITPLPVLTTSSASVPCQDLRFALIYDTQANASFPSNLQDVFLDISSAGATSATARSGVNPQWRERYIFLEDLVVPMPGYLWVSNSNKTGLAYQYQDKTRPSNHFSKFFDLRPYRLTTVFNNTTNLTGNTSQVTTGSLLLFMYNNMGGPVSASPVSGYAISYSTRVRFTSS